MQIFVLLPSTATPPATPTGLSADAGNAQVVLTWNAAAGATSYNIYRSTVSGGTTLHQAGVTAATFVDTGLANGTTYYYQVSAVNAAGESGKSGEVFATPEAPGHFRQHLHQLHDGQRRGRGGLLDRHRPGVRRLAATAWSMAGTSRTWPPPVIATRRSLPANSTTASTV